MVKNALFAVPGIMVGLALKSHNRFRAGLGYPLPTPFAGWDLSSCAVAEEIFNLGKEASCFWLGRAGRQFFELRQ
jgi:hypothetical protein